MRILIYCAILGIFSFLLSSCSRKVYSSPESEVVMSTYRSIAVLPPSVSIQGRPKENAIDLREYERQDSEAFQWEMATWLQRRKQQRGFWSMEVQDVGTTNAKLAALEQPELLTSRELAVALGVDAVIQSRFLAAKPVSREVAAAAWLLLDINTTTHRTEAFLEIVDAEIGGIWSYNWTARGGALTDSHHVLVDQLMQNASRRMPVPRSSK